MRFGALEGRTRAGSGSRTGTGRAGDRGGRAALGVVVRERREVGTDGRREEGRGRRDRRAGTGGEVLRVGPTEHGRTICGRPKVPCQSSLVRDG